MQMGRISRLRLENASDTRFPLASSYIRDSPTPAMTNASGLGDAFLVSYEEGIAHVRITAVRKLGEKLVGCRIKVWVPKHQMWVHLFFLGSMKVVSLLMSYENYEKKHKEQETVASDDRLAMGTSQLALVGQQERSNSAWEKPVQGLV
nr:hypothetical protein Iba_chr03bCG3110 [Ipomoea batatas]